MGADTRGPLRKGGPELATRDVRRLTVANVLMLVLMVLHDLDHVRQAVAWNYSIPLPLLLANMIVYVPNAVALFLILRRDRRAAFVTPFAGAAILIGFSVVHLIGAPAFLGVWATPFTQLHVDIWTWVIFGLTLAGCVPALIGGPVVLRRTAS
nr:hypothetical protein [Kibdelosporangium sp. MJ126-NF4]CEL16591.1 hypothetical protein [Kibdelosporangium sp. MJ126-NF4]CTQ89058.1 hypothetical protein [Kibdelosporangium sp. MJ126-NF4]